MMTFINAAPSRLETARSELALEMLRTGIFDISRESDRGSLLPSAEKISSSNLLRSYAEALLGDRFDNPVFTQVITLNAAQNPIEELEGFRQCLREILTIAARTSISKSTPQEDALEILIRAADDTALLRTAATFLNGREDAAMSAISAHRAKLEETRTPPILSLDTTASTGGTILSRFRQN